MGSRVVVAGVLVDRALERGDHRLQAVIGGDAHLARLRPTASAEPVVAGRELRRAGAAHHCAVWTAETASLGAAPRVALVIGQPGLRPDGAGSGRRCPCRRPRAARRYESLRPRLPPRRRGASAQRRSASLEEGGRIGSRNRRGLAGQRSRPTAARAGRASSLQARAAARMRLPTLTGRGSEPVSDARAAAIAFGVRRRRIFDEAHGVERGDVRPSLSRT